MRLGRRCLTPAWPGSARFARSSHVNRALFGISTFASGQISRLGNCSGNKAPGARPTSVPAGLCRGPDTCPRAKSPPNRRPLQLEGEVRLGVGPDASAVHSAAGGDRPTSGSNVTLPRASGSSQEPGADARKPGTREARHRPARGKTTRAAAAGPGPGPRRGPLACRPARGVGRRRGGEGPSRSPRRI